MAFANLGSDIMSTINEYGMSYLRGAGQTLILAFIGTLIGCIIGFLVGTVQAMPVPKEKGKRTLMTIARGVLRAYVEVFRGTPMIVQAVFIYYGAFYLGGRMSTWGAAILIVSINTGAYMAETVRGGILSIDPGQSEGTKAIGMTYWQGMISVILPQALRNIIPQIGNNFIINIKDTAVMSVISFVDLYYVHKSVAGSDYVYFPSAIIVMVLYLTMTLISSFLLRKWESRLAGDENYSVVEVGNDTLKHTSGLHRHRDDGKGTKR